MDSSNISTSWQPPPLSSLYVHDCEAGTSWLAEFMRVKTQNGTNATVNILTDIPMNLTTTYLRSMIPPNWTQPSSSADLIVWSIQLWGHAPEPRTNLEYEEWYNKTISFPVSAEACDHAICAKLGWQGDPDVSGIGMLISYYVALGLATIYFAVLAATRVGLLKPGHRGTRRSWMTTRLVESFQESINTFLDASLIFSASMLGAALVRYAAAIRDAKQERSAYGLLGSVFMSAFSVFPALMLQAVTDGPRTHLVRHLLWFAVIGFTIAVEVLYTNADRWMQEHASVDDTWSGLCEDPSLRASIVHALTAGHALLALNLVWWLYYLVLAAVPARWQAAWAARPSWLRLRWDWRTSLRLANGLLCLVAACFFISLFHRYRHSIHELTQHSDKDSEWQFGQVLALATWVPVGVDFFAILFYGPERGMSAKISDNYRVVPNHENPETYTKASTFASTFEFAHLPSRSHSNVDIRS